VSPIKAFMETQRRDSTASTASFDSIMDRRVEALMKKKKMDKLSAFFGKTPAELYADQEPPSIASSDEDLVPLAYVPPTQNDLDPAKKILHIKRQKKLNAMFGEKIDEHMAFKIATGCRQYSNTPVIATGGVVRSSSTYDVSFKDIEPPSEQDNKPYAAPFRPRLRSLSQSSISVSSNSSARSLSTVLREEKTTMRKKFSKLQSVLGDPLVERKDLLGDSASGNDAPDERRRKS
jgi:hypothetical protein